MRKLALLLALAAAGCAARSQPIEERLRVDVPSDPSVDVRVRVSPTHGSQMDRWTSSAQAAIRRHIRTLGRPPAAALTIVDRDVARREFSSAGPDVIVVDAPLWSRRRSMSIEAAVALAVARAFWRAALPCGPAGAAFVDGLARHSATVATAEQYDGARLPPAAGDIELRYAGGYVPWTLRAARPAWTDANGMDRTALAAQTLSNWMGAPTWEAVLRAFTASSDGRCPSWRDLQQSAQDVTATDLEWFFAEAFGSNHIYDYGVERLDSERQTGDRYRTTLVVRRFGDARFAGGGIDVAVRFADGSERIDRWDGAGARTFEYEGPAVIAAVVDPRQMIVLDVERTNNSRTLAPRTAPAATKWAALWGRWLQEVLLSYAAFV